MLLVRLSQDWKDARAMAGIAPNTEPVPAEVVQATQEGTVGDDGGKPSPTDGEQSEPVLVNSEQDELADEPGDSCAGDTNADPSTQSQCSDLIVTEEGDMNIDDATDDTGSIMSEPLVQSPGLDEPSADNDGADDRKEETSPPEGAIVGENNPMEQSSWRRAILQLENKNL